MRFLGQDGAISKEGPASGRDLFRLLIPQKKLPHVAPARVMVDSKLALALVTRSLWSMLGVPIIATLEVI